MLLQGGWMSSENRWLFGGLVYELHGTATGLPIRPGVVRGVNVFHTWSVWVFGKVVVIPVCGAQAMPRNQ